MQESANLRQVALLVETSNAYARGLLAGIWKYVSAHGDWSSYLMEFGRDSRDFSWLEGWSGHGILARIENLETAKFVLDLGVPVVDLSSRRFAPHLPGLETDDGAIAFHAVNHFAERGVRNFAFLNDSQFPWSVKRGFAFKQYVEELGYTSSEITWESGVSNAHNRSKLIDWLESLPKPVGILACYDLAGREILEACRLAKINVPNSVAVLGVDNDEILCNLSFPSLSSVEPDAIRTGYLAAEMLDQMMRGIPAEPGLRLIPPLRIVTRQSTDVQQVQDPIVVKALAFIRENSDKNLTVNDVLNYIDLSRRALDYKFQIALSRSVHNEIVRIRMERVIDLLLSTNISISQIAKRLNFSHSEYMSVAFKKHTGKSPGAYRSALKKT